MLWKMQDIVVNASVCRTIPQSSGPDESCCDSPRPIDGTPTRCSWISVISHQSRTDVFCDASSHSAGKGDKIWGMYECGDKLRWNVYCFAVV